MDIYRGKRVLVTGGAGSIGSEIVRQLLVVGAIPVVLSRDETKQHTLRMNYLARQSTMTMRTVIGDIRDAKKIKDTIDEHNVRIVIHAAAMKHVPQCESSPLEAIRTNIIGALNVHAAVRDSPDIELVVCVGTDKAANPSSVMGLTKRLQEKLFTTEYAGRARYVCTRFGNVLGSRGSVIDTFREQIRNEKPVTITHLQITRFAMTCEQAAKLVLWAGAYGPHHSIVVRKMMASYVVDWAKVLSELCGKTGWRNFQEVGLRPGEKLTEDLFNDDEKFRTEIVRSTEVGTVGIVHPLGGYRSKASDIDAEFDVEHNRQNVLGVKRLFEEAGIKCV